MKPDSQTTKTLPEFVDKFSMDQLKIPLKRYVGRFPGSLPPACSATRTQADDRRNHVLIVDDDPFFRSLLKLMLSQTGFPIAEIWEAEESRTALDICLRKPVDLVFCDLNLPLFISEDGLYIVRRLRKSKPGLPVYMVTSDSSPEIVRRGRAVGATGQLLKPINLRTLKRMLVSNSARKRRLDRTAAAIQEVEPDGSEMFSAGPAIDITGRLSKAPDSSSAGDRELAPLDWNWSAASVELAR